MKILRNYFYSALYQIFVLLVPLITIPYISRVLGPHGIGINTLTSSVTQYFVLFANLGLTMYGQREVAYYRQNRAKLSQTFWDIETLSILTTIFSLGMFYIFLNINGQYREYYLAQTFLILASAADVSWVFMGLENFKVTVLRNFIFKIISIFFIFTFVNNKEDLLKYILIISVSSFLGNLSLWPYLKKYLDKFSLQDLGLVQHLKPAIALFIPQIAINIYAVLNKIMLGKMISVEASGFFDSSDKIVRMVLTILTALTTVMMPHVANAYMNGQKEKVDFYLKKSFNISLFIAIPMMFGLNAIAADFVPLFFGKQFLPVIRVISIEAIAIIPIACAGVLGVQYLIPLKRTRQYTRSIFIGAGMNVLINIPLIHYFSASGAAVATVISETCVTLAQLYFVNKDLQISGLFQDSVKISISGFIMFVIIKLFSFYFSVSITLLVIEVIVGVLVYLISAYILRVKMFDMIQNFITRNK
ncbi:polysaccharide biosynthesis C-terminal domain-containing protein [Lactiplantibacillus plantarum]|uniref:oligosaccharide flippase family protein n=1 Tax=Lactiplantibacillus plantarum TaxID=1590 RepID=UPI0032DF5E94